MIMIFFNSYLLLFVYASRVSIALARSGLSSTILRVRMCVKLCKTVSRILTTAGFTLASVDSFSGPLLGEIFCPSCLTEVLRGDVAEDEEISAETSVKSRWIRRDKS